MTQLLTKKIPKRLIFKFFCWNYSEKWCKITLKCENWKWPLLSLTSIFSASSWPNVKSKDSFEKLRTSRFQNWPSFLNLVKIWGSYCQNTKVQVFLWTQCMSWYGALALSSKNFTKSLSSLLINYYVELKLWTINIQTGALALYLKKWPLS